MIYFQDLSDDTRAKLSDALNYRNSFVQQMVNADFPTEEIVEFMQDNFGMTKKAAKQIVTEVINQIL